MQDPAGALQPARLARSGQGGEEEEMGVSLGPILWRSLSSIVTFPPCLPFLLLTHHARCQATCAQQPEKNTNSALPVPAAITSWLFYSTMRASTSDEA